MPEKHSSVWIVVGIVAALLLGCVLGSCAGGIVGYSLAKRAVTRGINLQVPSQTSIPRAPLQPEEQVIVTQVVAGSPAERAGIVAGDIIIALNGQSFTRRQTLSQLLLQYKPGDTVSLTILRGGQRMEFPVTLGTNPALSGNRAWLGIYYNQ